MAAPEHLARHNYSDAEIFQAIQDKLESEKFDFTSHKASRFDATFGKSVRCDIRTQSDKLAKNRGWYHIKPNLNRETGEYWPTVIYRRIAGDGEIEKQKWSFSEFYLENKDLRPKQKYEKATPEQLAERQQRFEDDQRRDIRSAETEYLNQRDVGILSEIELNRAVTTHQVPGQNKKVFLNLHPYIGTKMFNGGYGVKMLNPTPFTEKEVAVHLKKFHPDLADPSKIEDSVQRIMKAQSRSIEREQDIDDPDDNSIYIQKSHRAFANLAVEIINIDNEVKNLQLINAYHFKDAETEEMKVKSRKGFLKSGATVGNFQVINTSGNPAASKFDKTKSTYILTEGWATGVTVDLMMKEAFPKAHNSTQTLSCLTKSNIAEVANEILSVNPEAKILIPYDNDASALLEKNGVNAGLEQAIRDFAPFGKLDNPNFTQDEIQSRIRTLIPPIGLRDKGITDWDDLARKNSQISLKTQGNNYRPDYYQIDSLSSPAEMFKQSILDAAQRKQDNVNEFEYLKNMYEAQRSEFYTAIKENSLPELKAMDSQKRAEVIDKILEQAKGDQPYPKSFSEQIDTKVFDTIEQAKGRRNAGLVFENFKYAAGLIDTPPDSSKNYLSTPFGHKFNKDAPVVSTDQIYGLQNANSRNSLGKLEKVQYQYDEKNDFDYELNSISPGASSTKVNALSLLNQISVEDVKKYTPNDIFVVQNESLTHIETNEAKISRGSEPLIEIKDSTLQNIIPVAANTIIPDRNDANQPDNISKAKTYLFTSYWLYNLELERAKKLVGESIQPGLSQEQLIENIKKNSDTASFSENGLSLGGEVILMATDASTRNEVLSDLKSIVAKRPDWDNMGKLANIVNDHVIEMRNADRENMLLNNRAITTIFANSGNTEDSNPTVINALKTALDSTSSLNIDRQSRAERYSELRDALLVLPDQEPSWVKEAVELCDKYVEEANKRYNTKPEYYIEVAKNLSSPGNDEDSNNFRP